MNENTKRLILVEIDGQQVLAPDYMSVIQAFWHAGHARIRGIGCLGGACGACRIMVIRPGTKSPTTELACETPIEPGMRVVFLDDSSDDGSSKVSSAGSSSESVLAVFPELENCRNCGGCTKVCPRDINAESGVNLIAAGRYDVINEIFESCVMCDLCSDACPEEILPARAGVLARALAVKQSPVPHNLKTRLSEMAEGKHRMD